MGQYTHFFENITGLLLVLFLGIRWMMITGADITTLILIFHFILLPIKIVDYCDTYHSVPAYTIFIHVLYIPYCSMYRTKWWFLILVIIVQTTLHFLLAALVLFLVAPPLVSPPLPFRLNRLVFEASGWLLATLALLLLAAVLTSWSTSIFLASLVSFASTSTLPNSDFESCTVSSSSESGSSSIRAPFFFFFLFFSFLSLARASSAVHVLSPPKPTSSAVPGPCVKLVPSWWVTRSSETMNHKSTPSHIDDWLYTGVYFEESHNC